MKQTVRYFYKNIVPIKLRCFINNIRQVSSYSSGIASFINNGTLYFKILRYFKHYRSPEYSSEIEYINNNGTLTPFPYNRNDNEPVNIEVNFDDERKLPFVYHKGKRLYFPSPFSLERAKQTYTNLIFTENILEGKYRAKTPHQYITDSFNVKKGDIVLDIGSAEGLFLLDVIDTVKKGYLIEYNDSFNEALKATFEPYKDKVTIINKLASNKDSATEITLDTCLQNDYGSIFVKMDVEGYEKLVLSGAKNVLHRKNDIRVVCSTYHKQDDASLLEEFFKGINYHTEFSDGYMIFFYDKEIKPPYLRKGLIRATNIL